MDRAGGFGPPGRGFKSSRARLIIIFNTKANMLYYFQIIKMSPGIGLMKRRLEKESDAVSLAKSGIIKKFKTQSDKIETLETKYDKDAGDWYVALGWDKQRVIVKMDSVNATITEIKEI